MWNTIVDLTYEILGDSVRLSLMFFAILIPLMVIIEFIKAYRLIDKTSRFFSFAARWTGISPKGVIPMFAGFTLGISYGSSLLIDFSKEDSLEKRDLVLIALFLCLCHGMIEDPLLFATIGANWWVILLARLVMAALLLPFIGHVIYRRKKPDTIG